MNRSKKIFLLIALVFLIILMFFVFDFAKRTEFRKPSGMILQSEVRLNA